MAGSPENHGTDIFPVAPSSLPPGKEISQNLPHPPKDANIYTPESQVCKDMQSGLYALCSIEKGDKNNSTLGQFIKACIDGYILIRFDSIAGLASVNIDQLKKMLPHIVDSMKEVFSVSYFFRLAENAFQAGSNIKEQISKLVGMPIESIGDIVSAIMKEPYKVSRFLVEQLPLPPGVGTAVSGVTKLASSFAIVAKAENVLTSLSKAIGGGDLKTVKALLKIETDANSIAIAKVAKLVSQNPEMAKALLSDKEVHRYLKLQIAAELKIPKDDFLKIGQSSIYFTMSEVHGAVIINETINNSVRSCVRFTDGTIINGIEGVLTAATVNGQGHITIGKNTYRATGSKV